MSNRSKEILMIGAGLLLLLGQWFLDGVHALGQRYRQYPRSYTALAYLFLTMAFCYHPVLEHWLGGFMMMSLPVAMLAGLTASLYLLRKQERLVGTVGLVWLALTLPIVKRLVGTGTPAPLAVAAPSLSVLSFNGECFREPHNAAISQAAQHSDIACFQEYSPNAGLEAQYTDKLTHLTRFADQQQIGLALFSRFPIVNRYGRIWQRAGAPAINGFLVADVAYGRDTVRIVNVHLWSMGVRINQALDSARAGNLSGMVTELADTFSRLKEGFRKRDEQVAEVSRYVEGSRYPVIICGDFNETPFGYAYGKLRLNFSNAFEEAGEGFGFTLNRHPYCVRIDQQFFSADWAVRSCRTLSGITVSDHFPVVAQYVLKKSVTAAPEPVLAQR
ncbi:hypothetical protein GCM10027578_21350 [Spirosoma luteolum]